MAVVIEKQGSNGADNNSNRFFGAVFEGNVTDVQNFALLTEFHGTEINYGKLNNASAVQGKTPLMPTWLLGGDPSQTPVVMPGVQQAEGSWPAVEAAIENSLWNFTKPLRVNTSMALKMVTPDGSSPRVVLQSYYQNGELTLETTAHTNVGLKLDDSSGGAYGGLQMVKSGTTVVNLPSGASAGPGYFNVNTNFGIGTNSPMAKLEVNGGIRPYTTLSRPTCTESIRGTIWYVPQVSGVQDTVDICTKDASDSYAWRSLW